MSYTAESVDVIVIGGGHAGIEAAFASARLGLKTIIFSMTLDFIGNLPCNPSIGGTAKGHLVREIDALGGEMGKAADYATIQSKMLNRGKGPAVHSLRVQADRNKYHTYMKSALENQENLYVKQAEIVDILTEDKKVTGVVTHLGVTYPCKAVILATGTFLRGKIFVGENEYYGGPDGLKASLKLSESLERLGVELRRFKTGTPARIHSDTINYSVLERQDGEEPVTPFSFVNTELPKNMVPCHIAYTNEKTHDIIRNNLDKSPIYSGRVEWIGARYCPSVEDKIVRFADKTRHQLFVEPMGLDTKEMYVQGLSTSLPEDVQIEFYRSVKGFENVEIMRTAYAIEYDCINPLEMLPTLELKGIQGFYSAGQINGTSGYEEAACQGLVAGINAANAILGREPLILPRSSSYIGTLIDDLVTKGCNEPYRVMTSRSEYRLLLRQDNADERLTPIGHKVGLISDERFEMFHVKQNEIQKEKDRIKKVILSPTDELNALLESCGTSRLETGVSIETLLKRPQVGYDMLAPFDKNRPVLERAVTEQVEISIKYEGYINRQLRQVEQTQKLEETPLDVDIDYSLIQGLRMEAREKLNKIKPLSVGQASRISGVSPADISVLLIYLEQHKQKGEKHE